MINIDIKRTILKYSLKRLCKRQNRIEFTEQRLGQKVQDEKICPLVHIKGDRKGFK